MMSSIWHGAHVCAQFGTHTWPNQAAQYNTLSKHSTKRMPHTVMSTAATSAESLGSVAIFTRSTSTASHTDFRSCGKEEQAEGVSTAAWQLFKWERRGAKHLPERCSSLSSLSVYRSCCVMHRNLTGWGVHYSG